jgi:hypothetical protein
VIWGAGGFMSQENLPAARCADLRLACMGLHGRWQAWRGLPPVLPRCRGLVLLIAGTIGIGHTFDVLHRPVRNGAGEGGTPVCLTCRLTLTLEMARLVGGF